MLSQGVLTPFGLPWTRETALPGWMSSSALNAAAQKLYGVGLELKSPTAEQVLTLSLFPCYEGEPVCNTAVLLLSHAARNLGRRFWRLARGVTQSGRRVFDLGERHTNWQGGY